MKSNTKYFLVFFALGLIYSLSFIYYQRWETNILGGGDSWGYNAYLPAIFIHHDLDNLKTTFATRTSYHVGFGHSGRNPLGTDCAIHIGNDKQVIKYTSGVAILQTPFFLVGHLVAGLTDYPQDGYSFPYIISVHLASFFYLLIGLWLLFLVLKVYFSETVSLLLLISLTLATNLYYFSIFSGPMAHAYLFACYGVLIYGTYHFYQKPGWLYAVLIGLSAGLITLIRPVEIICLAIPLFYGLGSQHKFNDRITFIRNNYRYFLLAIGLYILAGTPQLIYWKYVSGDWLFYSYGEEGFDFTNPEIWKGLTSFQNGWLIYTPIMWLALLGIIRLFKHRDWLLPVLVFLPIHIYITYSWWCWNYINGFGSRPMVEAYALLAFPLGYAFTWMIQKQWSRWLMYGLITLFCGLNLFQTYQHKIGIMWSQDVNPTYYWSTFGKTELNMAEVAEFDSGEPQPDTADLTFVKEVFFNNFEDSTDVHFQRDIVKGGQYAYRIDAEWKFAPDYAAPLSEIGAQPGDYLRFKVWCYKEAKEPTWLSMALMITTFHSGDKQIKYRHTRIGNKIHNYQPPSLWGGEGGTWDEVALFVKVPRKAKPEDIFKAYVVNTNYTLYIDDFKVELWRK
ncbi:MAG: hypothetical protein DHS20C18_18870 [Saprospiraceae bacterium]|nr:MAG: hypothetical protein DHS20C18_18870 [Saprospiraceae bacterium]